MKFTGPNMSTFGHKNSFQKNFKIVFFVPGILFRITSQQKANQLFEGTHARIKAFTDSATCCAPLAGRNGKPATFLPLPALSFIKFVFEPEAMGLLRFLNSLLNRLF